MNQPTRQRRGAAAVAMVVLMLLMSVMVISMVISGARHQDTAVQRLETVRSFYAAEAGMNMAIREVALNVDEDEDGTVGSIATISIPSFGGASVTVETERVENQTTLVSLGSVGGVRRRLRAIAIDMTSFAAADNPGLAAAYFALGSPPSVLADVDFDAVPSAVAMADNIFWPAASAPFWIGGPLSNYAARFAGSIYVPNDGTWTFFLSSVGGSNLWINGDLIVDNDGTHGMHGMQSQSGSIELESGWHQIELRCFHTSGSHGLFLEWTGPGVPSVSVIPPQAFGHGSSDLHQPIPRLAVRELFYHSGNGASSNSTIDGFNAMSGPYDEENPGSVTQISVNSTANNAMRLNRMTVHGDVFVGPGGNPSSVISIHNSASITGSVAAMASEITWPRIVVPNALPVHNPSVLGGTHVLSQNFHCNDLTIDRATVNVTRHVVGRIDGDLSMLGTSGNPAVIRILPGASLTLYVFGNAHFDSDSRVNMNTGNPNLVRIHVLGIDSEMTTGNGLEVAARLVCPYGSFRPTGNPSHDSRFFGSYFGREIRPNRRSLFHVSPTTFHDDSANDTDSVVSSWAEVAPGP